MHLKNEWQKVQLAHVSSGRSFFVFTRGDKHQETISMTSRMLARMCETGRLRAVESAYLMERATARARKQLAAARNADAPLGRSTARAVGAARRARHAHRRAQARRIGTAAAGDVERGAVVGAGAHERQAERDVDAVLDAEILHRDQAVVVRHRDDDVELAGMAGGVAGAHEHRVGRERAARVDALGARRLHRRGDDAQLLVAEQAALAGVRIEPGDGDARLAPP